MLYGFAFTRRNISCQTLYSLACIEHRFLLWGEKSIDTYLELLLRDQPSYILGMGICSGHDRKLIRIETKCSHLFRKRAITVPHLDCYKQKTELDLNPFVTPTNEAITTESIGTSWCNMACFKIQSLIDNGLLNSRFTFLHLPRDLAVAKAVNTINVLISEAV